MAQAWVLIWQQFADNRSVKVGSEEPFGPAMLTPRV
jgi:hypothetical protein